MNNIVDKVISTNFEDLDSLELNLYEKIGLIVMYKNSKYEFIIHLVSSDDNMVVFGSSFLSPQEKLKFINKPVFERQSWYKDIKHNVLYYNDPTLYDYEELDGGWGIGTPDNWHLENISKIIKKLACNFFDYENLKIPKYGNLFFYGSSMGGFMSIALSILIENSTSIADSPQLNLFSWWYWDSLRKSCFKDFSDEKIMQYSHRLDIIDLISMKKIIPNSYIILDCSDERDWVTQYRYFLNKFDSLPYTFNKQNNKINIYFLGKCIGHNMLYKNETINFIEEVIDSQEKKFLYDPIKSEMLIEFKNHIEKLYFEYENNNMSFDSFKNSINIYSDKWNLCRVDLKNNGDENNSLVILDKSDNVDIEVPNWFKDKNGEGFVFSSSQNFKLKIKCVNSGELSFDFRGQDYRLNNRRSPIYCCYKKFKINNKLIFAKDFLLWHNLPHVFTKWCENNEIIDIEVIFETIYDYFPDLKNIVSGLNQNEDDLENNYWMVISYLERLIKENNP